MYVPCTCVSQFTGLLPVSIVYSNVTVCYRYMDRDWSFRLKPLVCFCFSSTSVKCLSTRSSTRSSTVSAASRTRPATCVCGRCRWLMPVRTRYTTFSITTVNLISASFSQSCLKFSGRWCSVSVWACLATWGQWPSIWCLHRGPCSRSACCSSWKGCPRFCTPFVSIGLYMFLTPIHSSHRLSEWRYMFVLQGRVHEQVLRWRGLQVHAVLVRVHPRERPWRDARVNITRSSAECPPGRFSFVLPRNSL